MYEANTVSLEQGILIWISNAEKQETFVVIDSTQVFTESAATQSAATAEISRIFKSVSNFG